MRNISNKPSIDCEGTSERDLSSFEHIGDVVNKVVQKLPYQHETHAAAASNSAHSAPLRPTGAQQVPHAKAKPKRVYFYLEEIRVYADGHLLKIESKLAGALVYLKQAGLAGCSKDDLPNLPRLVSRLRRLGILIDTNFTQAKRLGYAVHTRYVLRSQIQISDVELNRV